MKYSVKFYLLTLISLFIVVQHSLSQEQNYTSVVPLENTQKLYYYRLALPVEKGYYATFFNNDEEKVFDFWNKIEIYLNSLFVRDLGVKFQVIKDRKLIVTDATVLPSYFSPTSIVKTWGTIELNNLIGEENYDAGLWLARYKGSVAGLAALGGVYEKLSKGGATSKDYDWNTIAHELGHLFGGTHTGIEGLLSTDSGSLKTEPKLGQSILSYNGTRTFFSLHSIAQIWNRLKKQPYYSNREKTQMVDIYHMNDNVIYADKLNIVYAKEQNVEVPVIDTETLEVKSYQIPKGTYFSLFVPTKEKQEYFTYLVHPKTQVEPQFISTPASAFQRIDFQEKYSYAGGLELGSESTMKVGHYPITLAISNYDKTKEVAPVYATKDIEVEVVNSEPFKYIGGVGSVESAGKITTIRWQTGGTLFQDKKIRITMSDDYGKTFQYVLADETENDGECEVILPYINVDKKEVGYEEKLNPCLIRLEVIGNIAYATSNFSPRNRWGKFQGGFTLTKYVEFRNTPKMELNVKTLSEVPSDKGAVIAYANGVEQEVIYETMPEQTLSDGSKLIRRIWKTEDKRFNFATKRYFAFEQRVYVGKNTKQDDSITSTPKTEKQKQRLYPNPVTNTLNISGAKSNDKVTIYSLDGRKLIEQKADAVGYLQVNMQHRISGFYIVKVGSKSWKILKR